jgi:hypothetical protein
MLGFELVDINASDCFRQMENYPDQTIFQTRAWLSFVAKTQNAEPVIAALREKETTEGYFTGLIVRKYGFRILGSPFPGWTTSYMGLCLSPNVSRRYAIQRLVEFAFDDLNCVHIEIMDRQLTLDNVSGLGFEDRILSTFEIDLTQSESVLFGKISSACRRCIRKAESNGVVIEEASDFQFADEYYSQLQDVFAKQSLVPPYSVERVRQLIERVYPTGMLLLLRARDQSGRCIASGIFPAMKGTMYFWGGASYRQYQILRPNEAIQWYAMRYWRKRGIQKYDMGGGGEYKKKYGGYPICVPWFRKSKYRSICKMRNSAEQLVRGYQQLLGYWRSW